MLTITLVAFILGILIEGGDSMRIEDTIIVSLTASMLTFILKLPLQTPEYVTSKFYDLALRIVLKEF